MAKEPKYEILAQCVKFWKITYDNAISDTLENMEANYSFLI
jgi:hypothetical protein